MRVLGIETSCDETAVGIVENGTHVLANVIASQQEFHEKYGGVVPEVAARKHLETLPFVTREAMEKASLQYGDIDGIAVTYAPGFEAALLIGLQFAKGLALASNIPWIGVHHMEGHIYANFLDHPEYAGGPAFPFISLLVSGGHTMLVYAKSEGEYVTLGNTLDDAAGEAFDKVGRYLGLPFPGGPAIDAQAAEGDPHRIPFPWGVRDRQYDFSYSGLKTAVVNFVEKNGREGHVNGTKFSFPDLLASFQSAAVDVMVAKTLGAAKKHGVSRIAIGGGVASNSRLRREIKEKGEKEGLEILIPPAHFCTDNGAMIAAAGTWRLKAGQKSPWGLSPTSRLPLPSESR